MHLLRFFRTGCLIVACLSSIPATGGTLTSDEQKAVEVAIPETYELANVILALTEYGRTDRWEVQKDTRYHADVMEFFRPVLSHPLLQRVNYSRQQWESYLSFRTDAVAFAFDENGELQRTVRFHTNPGVKPFDDHLELVQDFVEQSNFRLFYSRHRGLYDSIVARYAEYYMVDDALTFLETEFESVPRVDETYRIVLSPLVGRMNCHRRIDRRTVADFPSLARSLVQNDAAPVNDAERAVELHTLFTELDHGFVNPLSARYNKALKGFDAGKWDNGSGYEGVNCFNEYMTWAVYDLFIEKHFPKSADSVKTQWHYQNANRGFFASSLFADTVLQRYKRKAPHETFADIYPAIIAWCLSVQGSLAMPSIVYTTADSVFRVDEDGTLRLKFSTPMARSNEISCLITETGSSVATPYSLVLTPDRLEWLNDKELVLFGLNTASGVHQVTFNWWGCKHPLLSKQSVMLKAPTAVRVRK